MYVCLCKGVTDKQIKQELADKGPGKIKEVCSKLGVGKDCGTCLIQTEQIVSDLVAAHNKSKKSFRI